MEKMYQQYKDIAEFRLVYIHEAHAMDSNRPTRLAEQKGIKNHTNYEERCSSAQILLEEGKLTMPMLIDKMDNSTNGAYSALPDRVFLVRTDGRLAVAAARGPFGFGPGLDAAEEWLENFRESGEEPELSPEAIEKADRATAARQAKLNRETARQVEKISGDWTVTNVLEGKETTGSLNFSVEESQAAGVGAMGSSEWQLENIRFNGTQLSFNFMDSETRVSFSGKFDGTQIVGQLEFGEKTIESTMSRVKTP